MGVPQARWMVLWTGKSHRSWNGGWQSGYPHDETETAINMIIWYNMWSLGIRDWHGKRHHWHTWHVGIFWGQDESPMDCLLGVSCGRCGDKSLKESLAMLGRHGTCWSCWHGEEVPIPWCETCWTYESMVLWSHQKRGCHDWWMINMFFMVIKHGNGQRRDPIL